MKHRHVIAVAACSCLLMLAACNKSSTAESGKTENAGEEVAASAASTDPIESAMSAAPASIAKDAKIVAKNADGSMKVLRDGTNGFTCMPDNPVTPGPDPMCMDANAMRWAEAWIGHKPPPADTVGVMYMLAGGTDFSNTDPYATAPSEADYWVKTGPHLMVVGSEAVLKGYPSGAKPDTRAPYVMWAGTPYAHLMIPVG